MFSAVARIIDVVSALTSRPLTLRIGGNDVCRFDNAGRRDPRCQAFRTDDFFSGPMTSGNIGELGWSYASAGTVTATRVAATAGHVGVVAVTSSAAVQTCGLNLSETAAVTLLPSDFFDLMFIARVQSNVQCAYNIGLYDGTNASLNPTNGIYIQRNIGANYFGVCRAAGTQTVSASNLGIAPDTNFHAFRIRRVDASTIGFSIDDNAEQTVTSNIPTAVVNPYIGMFCNDGSAKTFEVDYFDMTVRLSR